MKYLFCIFGVTLLFLPVVHAEEGKLSAQAVLMDLQGAKVGTALLTEEAGGVRIVLEVSNLSSGPHAFHIHEIGKCIPPDFASAGKHFNPDGKKHGLKNPEGPHAGDLPNIEVGADGSGKIETVAQGLTLGEGVHSLFHSEGTSIVIHAGPDDEVTDPAGNSGARIACGVITK